MSLFKDMFGVEKPILGMVHLLALPGSPAYEGSMSKIYDQALEEALDLQKGGVHALIIENAGDTPFLPTLETEQVAALAALAAFIRQRTKLPLGVDAVFSDYKASLACAVTAGGSFVRIPAFVDRLDTFSGVLEPAAAWAIRYRRKLDAENIKIFADIQVKYTRRIVPAPLEESAVHAASAGADALIVTGTHSGSATPLEAIRAAKKSVTLPILVGSGLNAENIKEQLGLAEGAIVGTHLKTQGKIDINKVVALMKAYGEFE